MAKTAPAKTTARPRRERAGLPAIPSSKPLIGGKAAEKKRSSSSRFGLVLLALAIAAAGMLWLASTIVIVAGLIPTIVAYIYDRDPEKYAPMIVGSLNLCGVLPVLISLWQGGHTMEMVGQVLASPLNWLIMYTAAGAGWVLYFTVPPLLGAYLAARHEGEVKRHKDRMRELRVEWGNDIALTPEALMAAAGNGQKGQTNQKALAASR